MLRGWQRIGATLAVFTVVIIILCTSARLQAVQNYVPARARPALNALPDYLLGERPANDDKVEPGNGPQASQSPAAKTNEATANIPDLKPNAEITTPTPAHEDSESNSKISKPTHTQEELEPSPTPRELSKTIVMGKLLHENTDWVSHLHGWQTAIYVANLSDTQESPTGLRTKVNKGHEAMPYLSYIVDNYPEFPDIQVFMHAHRMDWHNDALSYDAVRLLRELRLKTVLQRGYVNLRCIMTPGCPAEIKPFDNPWPGTTAYEFPKFYSAMFEVPLEGLEEVIPVVAVPCCAQFAVTKETILQRPKSDYERFMRLLEETELKDELSGRVFEYMWHIIFGKDAVHCQNLNECWCDVFGRCDVTWQWQQLQSDDGPN